MKTVGGGIGNDDLQYAEEIASHGTRTERLAHGIVDPFTQGQGGKVEAQEQEDDFPFNDEGLTSIEAERRLAIYGMNDLPQKVDSKWLILFRILTQPMVRVCICVLFLRVCVSLRCCSCGCSMGFSSYSPRFRSLLFSQLTYLACIVCIVCTALHVCI